MRALIHTAGFRIAAGIALGLALLLLVLHFAFSRGKALDERHEPFVFSESFDFDTGTLAGYEAYARRLLRAAHPDATDAVIADLAAFRMDPPPSCPAAVNARHRSGVVLTHDVLDTPYTLRELGKYFQRSCFVVYGLLLPGHGTRAGALLDSGWQEWFAAQRFAARELGREVENLYLAGHGVGGTLALLEAATNATVDGVILFAPRLDVQAQQPWQASVDKVFGWLVPAARWGAAPPALTPYRDASWPWRLAVETNNLVASTQAALASAPVEPPVFTVVTLDDASVNAQAALDFMATRSHPRSHTLLFARQAPAATPATTVIGLEAFQGSGLLGLSHLGLVVPGHDPVFGREGSARQCDHYYAGETASYARCIAGEAELLGEVTPENLGLGLVQRLAYNPRFNDMLDALNGFIAPAGRVIPRIRR